MHDLRAAFEAFFLNKYGINSKYKYWNLKCIPGPYKSYSQAGWRARASSLRPLIYALRSISSEVHLDATVFFFGNFVGVYRVFVFLKRRLQNIFKLQRRETYKGTYGKYTILPYHYLMFMHLWLKQIYFTLSTNNLRTFQNEYNDTSDANR